MYRFWFNTFLRVTKLKRIYFSISIHICDSYSHSHPKSDKHTPIIIVSYIPQGITIFQIFQQVYYSMKLHTLQDLKLITYFHSVGHENRKLGLSQSELMSGDMSAILFAIFATTPHIIAVDSTDQPVVLTVTFSSLIKAYSI